MEPDRPSNGDGESTVVSIDAFRCRSRKARLSAPERVQVEITCGQAMGEAVKRGLEQELISLGGVKIVEDSPDWVYSIVAFHKGQLVELSVILRRFFRASKPGSERMSDAEGDCGKVKPGAWVYESLRFHGLFGVRVPELKQLFESIAHDFNTTCLNRTAQGKPPRNSNQEDTC